MAPEPTSPSAAEHAYLPPAPDPSHSRPHARLRWLNAAWQRAARSVSPSHADGRQPPWRYPGYGVAIAGVALASGLIAFVTAYVRVSNISLIYLLPVLWLAARYGRGPAVFASVLAFLAYDFFFIPPFHRLTVDDPTEWLSLFALLAISLVLGQLTARVQARAAEAVASQRRTATMYALAQLIVTITNSDELATALMKRVIEVFHPSGVESCALLMPDDSGRFTVSATASSGNAITEVFDLDDRGIAAEVAWAFEHGAPVGRRWASHAHGGVQRQGPDVAYYFLPLRSGRSTVGVLGIAGRDTIRGLVVSSPATTGDRSPQIPDARQVELFAAFCDQIALALERAILRRQAIHAEVLLESDRLKNVLLGSVSHDLRTPLASIKAAASSLLQPGVTWSEEDQRELLTTIDTSADRLNRLVGNLLDLSRLEAGVAVPLKDWYFIGEVIATVLDHLDIAGVTRQHHVEVDVPADVPLVPMDYGQIEQVLTNLIENATKYSPAGSEIRVQARVLSTSELEVRISDQGIGIPANELLLIFDKFYRVQHVELPWASSRPPIGSGLGLAICASIIQAHSGRIWAESEPGQGATFIFTLPLESGRSLGELPEIADGGEAAGRILPESPANTSPGAADATQDISNTADGKEATA